jgi:hypothetical protein
MRLKNAGDKPLTIPLANPEDGGATFFEVGVLDSDGWCPFGREDFIIIRPTARWEIPYVTLGPGEDALVWTGGWDDRCSAIRMRLRVHDGGNGRWSGVVETPEIPIYASYGKKLPLPTYFPDFSPKMHMDLTGNLSGDESKFDCLIMNNNGLVRACDLYEQGDVEGLMKARMTDADGPNLKLFYAYLSRKAGAHVPTPTSQPESSECEFLRVPSAEDVIRNGLHSTDLDVLQSAIDVAVEDLEISPHNPFLSDLESLRKTLGSPPDSDWKDRAERYLEGGFSTLEWRESTRQAAAAEPPPYKVDKRERIEQLLAELKSPPKPRYGKFELGGYSPDPVAGIAYELRGLTGQRMGGDWPAWDLWWRTKGKTADWTR